MRQGANPGGLSHRQAVALALAAYTLWVLVDTAIKLAGATTLPTPELIALLGLGTAGFMAAWCVPRGQARALWPRRPGPQVVRALLDLGNLIGVVIALRHLPLSLFYVLVFCSPMVTTLLAAAWLGERLERRKIIAIVAGFVGVVIAVAPLGLGRGGEWRGYLACMGCVLCFSTSIVWSRRLTQTESPESLTFFSGAVTALAGGGGMLLGAATPVPWRLGAVLAGAGLVAVLGSVCFFVALRHSSAATVSQYHYSQLVVGALLAYVIWHDRPSVWMGVGAALIIGAGLYTASRADVPLPLDRYGLADSSSSSRR